MSRSEDPRIVHVASSYAGELDLKDLQFEKRTFNGGSAYAQSKQVNRMLSKVRPPCEILRPCIVTRCWRP